MNKQMTVIEPKKKWQLFDWKELYSYKDLLYFLVLRDVKVLYKQTVLGFAWAILQPVFSMIVFTFVFGKMAKVPSDNIPYPIFSFAALVPWTYFSQSLVGSTNSLVAGTQIFTKVYFPRVIIPMVPPIAKLVDFGIAFIILLIMIFAFGLVPDINILWLPYLVLLMVLTASGIGMWLSALAIQYRDVKFTINFLSQLLMYAAPVVWPASLIRENFGEWAYWLYGLYPMSGVVEGFRAALLGVNPMPYPLLISGTFAALLIFLTGALFYRRMEDYFADVA